MKYDFTTYNLFCYCNNYKPCIYSSLQEFRRAYVIKTINELYDNLFIWKNGGE